MCTGTTSLQVSRHCLLDMLPVTYKLARVSQIKKVKVLFLRGKLIPINQAVLLIYTSNSFTYHNT